MGFLGILGFIFVTLKLTGYIVWSWWLVLLPFITIPAIWALFTFVIYKIFWSR